MKLCLLISVWPDYRWLVPMLEGMLREFWPSHPEIVFTPLVGDGTNWTRNLKGGVLQAKERGYEAVYLINEEHLPIAGCNEDYLERLLPNQALELNAAYVSLFGWDNKRFCSKSPILKTQSGAWMRLSGANDPRFHLHPAWWRLDALEACCDLVLRDGRANGSAWHFEKTCDDIDVSLPSEIRGDCFQICAGLSGLRPLGVGDMRNRIIKRWIFNKAMALTPVLPRRTLQKAWVNFWNFDDVVSDGAFPMVFSGVLAKGKINPTFVNACRRSPAGRRWLEAILQAFQSASC